MKPGPPLLILVALRLVLFASADPYVPPVDREESVSKQSQCLQKCLTMSLQTEISGLHFDITKLSDRSLAPSQWTSSGGLFVDRGGGNSLLRALKRNGKEGQSNKIQEVQIQMDKGQPEVVPEYIDEKLKLGAETRVKKWGYGYPSFFKYNLRHLPNSSQKTNPPIRKPLFLWRDHEHELEARNSIEHQLRETQFRLDQYSIMLMKMLRKSQRKKSDSENKDKKFTFGENITGLSSLLRSF